MITVSNLTFSYQPGQLILDGLDLNIDRGSLFGLVGPNGAGKSTLISLLTGLNVSERGRIEINGRQPAADRMAMLRRLALVPQEYAFYPRLTAGENLEFFSRLYPRTSERAKNLESAIVLTGLEACRDRLARHLSGGLKRRLNLAIGLLNRPEILILDEPTVGIDPQSRHFILHAIRQLNEQGTTVLFTSHYMDEVEQLCDALAIIDHGKILASGKLADLLSTQSGVTITIGRGDVPDLASRIIQAFPECRHVLMSGMRLQCDLDNPGTLARMLQWLIEGGYGIEDVRYGRQSLESVYFSLTRAGVRE